MSSKARRAKPSGPERRRPVARCIAIAPPPPPSIPTESELRTQYENFPGYRLLVLYLGRFTPEMAIMIKNLTSGERDAIHAFHPSHPRFTPPKPPRPLGLRKEPEYHLAVGRQVRCWLADGAEVRGRLAAVTPERLVLDREGERVELGRADVTKARLADHDGPFKLKPTAFHLAVAWLLMERENQEAAQDRRVIPVLAELAQEWNCAQETLLRLSYLPRRVLGLLDVFWQAVAESRENANEVRRYRQLEAGRSPPRRTARDQPLPEELLRLSLTSLGQELAWWKALGFDKESGALSRQGLWRAIEPLVGALLGGHRTVSWRKVSRDVFKLLDARYPDLSPGPEVIRKRHLPS